MRIASTTADRGGPGHRDPGERQLLENIRVLDFSRYIAGPYCASILGDLGAEVIRIEPVGGGEDRRLIPVTTGGEGALFLQMNRNKKSVALDIADAAARHVVERLIRTADVAVTNMPPAALERHGLDYGTLQRLKPDIIATNLSAFGTSGTLAGKTGFDAVAQAMSGAAFLGGDTEEPSRSAASYVDYGTGLAGALGTLAAIIHRAATGEGQNVQASLLATALTFFNAAHIEAAATGSDREPYGNRSPHSAPSDFVPTLDGVIAVQVVGNPMFRRWAKLMGRPELARDPRYASDTARGRNGEALSRILREWAATRSSAEAIALLGEAGVPAGPVYSPLRALRDPGIAQTGIFRDTAFPGFDGQLPIAGLLVHLDSVAESVRTRAPLAGEHTREVLLSAGYSAGQIDALIRDGTVAGKEAGRAEAIGV